MNVALTASQVVELVTYGTGPKGFNPRQLQYWTAEDIVRPVDPTAVRHRRYSREEAVIARACALLSAGGVSVPMLKPISLIMRELLERNSAPAPTKKMRDARAALADPERNSFLIIWPRTEDEVSAKCDWAVADLDEIPSLWGQSRMPGAVAFLLHWSAMIEVFDAR
jgi:DNA-binding transcriptional MerR regulator